MDKPLNTNFTKFLALDLGEKRIGIALSDTLKMIATAHDVMPRRSRKEDFAYVARIVKKQNVARIIVGLPKSLDGSEGRMAAWARDYGADLSETVKVPVVFWDESFTSEMAAQAMAAQGKSRKQMKDQIDAVAAALILQSYLEAGREHDGLPLFSA